MLEQDIFSDLIGDVKGNTTGELIVVLFELCNLNCQACYQDHNSVEGIDQVKEKLPIIKHALDVLKQRGKQDVTINLMGGELFLDQLPDSIFEDYLFLIKHIRVYADLIELPIKINVSSNLIYENVNRVKSFLETAHVNLNASYDPAGRFNPTTLEKFIENTVIFKNYIQQIGVVMTKPSIRKLMSSNAQYFDYLYNNFEINFDHYTHGGRAKIKPEILMPLDVELRDFYKFMIDNYPKAYPFCETLISLQQSMFCMRTMYVFHDSSFGSCGSTEKLIKPLVSADKPKKIIKITKETVSPLEKTIESKWYSDYNCLGCEHLQRCSMSCFLNNHFYNTRTQETCWLKEVYDFVDSKNISA